MQAQLTTEQRTQADRDLLIVEASGNYFNLLLHESSDDLGGIFGISNYIIHLVDECINSDEYKDAIEYEVSQNSRGNDRWRYFEINKGTSLDWYFLEKIAEKVLSGYHIQLLLEQRKLSTQ